MKQTNFLKLLLAVVGANFLAQIPYYLHQYYLPSHAAPALVGLVLMGVVLAWFGVGFAGLRRGSRIGYYLTLTFLMVEWLFYLQTQIVQALTGHGILLYVWHPSDMVLFIVFGLGYINFFASFWFVYFMLSRKAMFLRS
jgi:hypothetical protein